ncbi:probable dolichyl-diphosphooligosaccharide--protein glycosyltransferase subunit 3 [Elaeis guineensis]|uniref:Probable dolichyl-diphosphooligosaccharide--protein glycosyltransferase subunit 3 n=1 Tax=Elaeis guineensis var. tenera TaxID=51953 RepID=A0A6I9RTM7_ELAGV|nr:probable dolichyl-diphosphooligosaccharide--protein glycosyltransferase subunit 3 [Elaeis guineensis]
MELKIPRVLLLLLLVAVAALISLSSAASPTADDLVAELETLRSQSPSGVIHFDDSSVARFLTSAPLPRPYSLLVFFGASKPDHHLRRLRSEFALVSSSFAAHHASSRRVFFCDLEYQESESSFSLFGVTSLPDIRHVGPQHRSLRDSDRMDQSDFSGLAASMAQFVEAKTSLPVGPIVRPSLISPRQIAFLAVALLISAPFLIKRILEGKTMLHDRRLWMGLTVSVYFLGVAGLMHNIIHKIPMYVKDRKDPNRLIFFVKGFGMQLGAEGFAVGFLYTIVGLIVAFATHVLVRMRNEAVQRGFLLAAMLVVFWAVRKVIYLHNWKTGYTVHTFWPTRWR